MQANSTCVSSRARHRTAWTGRSSSRTNTDASCVLKWSRNSWNCAVTTDVLPSWVTPSSTPSSSPTLSRYHYSCLNLPIDGHSYHQRLLYSYYCLDGKYWCDHVRIQVYVRCKVEICRFGCPEHCDKSNSADPSSYTSEIKASFSAPVRSALPAPVGPVAAVPVAAAVVQPQPPQLLPPQFTPQKYPERRSRPEPEVTRRPFFNLGSKPVFANFFQRKKDSVQAALPVLSPPPPAVAAAQIAQRLDVEAQVVAVPIPIPGSQTQSDQVVVAVPVPVVQPQTDAVQARDDSSDDSAASASDAQPISEDQYSERSSRFPHGPRSLNLDDLK